MRNTYLTDKFLDKRDLLNEHALQSWAIKKIRNKRTFISLHFTANNAIVKKGDIQLLIDRETAKKLTEIFNKEFEFDEIYKSIYKKYWSNIIEMAKPINAEIKLIDKIISIEGLRYWGDLLNIRTFYKILNKYENKCKKNNFILCQNRSVEVLQHFESAFGSYWSEEMKTIKEQFSYFLLHHKTLEKRLSCSQVDRTISTVEAIIKSENYLNYDNLMSNLDKLEDKYKNYLTEKEIKQKNILIAIKYLRKFKIRTDIEKEFLSSITPIEDEDYVI